MYKRSFIWPAEKKMEDMTDHCSYARNLNSFEIKP